MAQNESRVEMIEFLVGKKYTNNKLLLSKKILTKALIASCKTGSLDTIVTLIGAGTDTKKYRKEILTASRKRPHIYDYVKKLVNV